MPTDKQSAERARAREFRKKWNSPGRMHVNDHETDQDMMMDEFAALAVLREREDCAKAVCDGCKREAITLRVGEGFFHLADGQYVGCSAAAIWRD